MQLSFLVVPYRLVKVVAMMMKMTVKNTLDVNHEVIHLLVLPRVHTRKLLLHSIYSGKYLKQKKHIHGLKNTTHDLQIHVK